MVTRRDLLKMGIVGSSGFVALPPGGGFGRVSRFFDNNRGSSRRLTPFVDELPGTGASPFQTLSAADGFPHDIRNRPSSFPAQVTIPVGGYHDYAYAFADVGIFDGPIEGR